MLVTTLPNVVHASEAKTWPSSLVSAPVALGGEASQLICFKLFPFKKGNADWSSGRADT